MHLRTIVVLIFGSIFGSASIAMAADRSAHDFGFLSIEGEPLPLSSFAGKAVLVVNTASQCGFTGQYADLQSIWQRYRDRGFVVLGRRTILAARNRVRKPKLRNSAK